jgi:hypothetical protein
VLPFFEKLIQPSAVLLAKNRVFVRLPFGLLRSPSCAHKNSYFLLRGAASVWARAVAIERNFCFELDLSVYKETNTNISSSFTLAYLLSC